MPSLLPDESLYSLLGRIVLLNAYERPQRSLRRLIGGHLAVASVDLTSRIAALHKRLGTFSPASSAQELLERSTLYLYHREFLPSSRSDRVAYTMLHGPAGGLKSFMGLAANRFGATTTLRYCSQCAREDHHRHGTSYWRRAHHLPGVGVCAQHGLSLVAVVDPSSSGNKHALCLPPWHVSELKRVPSALPNQWRFACLSAQALHQPAIASTETHRAAVYQRAVIDRGYAGARARIDYESLARALLAHHGNFQGFEHQARLLATDKTPLAWLRPLLMRPQRAMHPICHLVLIDFLFGSWAGYQDAMVAQPPVQATALPVMPSPEKAADAVVPDPVMDPSLSCRQAAQACGLCVTTVATRRRAAGLFVAARRKTVCGPVLDRVRKLVLEGFSPAQIADRTGVSMSTAYRLRREHLQALSDQRAARDRQALDAQRQTWLSLAHSNLTVNVARQRTPACYAWLYRNDRDWLMATNATFVKPTPSRTRVDWMARDRAWREQAEAFACAWRAQHPRARLSPSAVRRALCDWIVRAHRRRLPLLIQRINEVSESRLAFRSARLAAALKDVSTEGASTVPWRVLKRAGLRPPSSPPLSIHCAPHNHANPLPAESSPP